MHEKRALLPIILLHAIPMMVRLFHRVLRYLYCRCTYGGASTVVNYNNAVHRIAFALIRRELKLNTGIISEQ